MAMLAIPLPTQQDVPRGKFAGWVRGTDGERVVGADVTLLARPMPGRPDIGTRDQLQVRTGKDGLFRTQLLHGRSYSAWATFRDTAGGEQRTEVLEGVFPGPPRELIAAPAQIVRELVLTGAKAWQARAPFTVTAFTGSDNVLDIPLQLDAQLAARLPTLPGELCSIEVRGADGFLIGLANYLELAAPDHQSKLEIPLPPPTPYRVVVQDELGKPIAGAIVRHDFGHHSRDLSTVMGITDNHGELRMLIPAINPMYGDGKHSCRLLVEAPGRQRTLKWINLNDDKTKSEYRMTLRPGITLKGRVLNKHGKPASGITVLPDCYAIGADHASTGVGVPLQAAPLDGNGQFTFGSLHDKYDFRLLACIEPTAAMAAGMRLHQDIAVAPVIWLAVGAPPFAKPHDLGDIRLDQVQVAQIQVQTDSGVPVPGAHLTATTSDLYVSPLDYTCDRIGRLQMPLPKGEIHIGAWSKNNGVARVVVRSSAAEEDRVIDPLVLKLSATRTVHGVVVGPDDQPIAGAVVHQWNRAKIDDRAIAELTFKASASSEPSGIDGKFTLTLPLDDATFALRCFKKMRGAMHDSGELIVTANEGNTARPLRIRLAPSKAK